jgi:hypothetical protein
MSILSPEYEAKHRAKVEPELKNHFGEAPEHVVRFLQSHDLANYRAITHEIDTVFYKLVRTGSPEEKRLLDLKETIAHLLFG